MSSYFPRIFCAVFLVASFLSSAESFAVGSHSKANERHLILVTDVYQEEQKFAADAFVVTTALNDKVSPIVTDKHTLQFVTSTLIPSQWHIYKKSNLVLLIPKEYLKNHSISAPIKQDLIYQDGRRLHSKMLK